MNLSWYSTCNVCNVPLNPKIRTRGEANKIFVRHYKNVRPLFTYNNEKFYSFIGNGLKVKPVCYSCFIHKPKPLLEALRSRELGQCRNVLPKSKSKSEKEIVQWFDGLVREATKRGLIKPKSTF